MTIPGALRTSIVARAANRCEYCTLSQLGQEATFHIDHVIPRASGGPTDISNLALACVGCSLHKAARLVGPDSESGQEIPLFNPRSQQWVDHFRWEQGRIVGITKSGRATVACLQMNRPVIVAIGREQVRNERGPTP